MSFTYLGTEKNWVSDTAEYCYGSLNLAVEGTVEADYYYSWISSWKVDKRLQFLCSTVLCFLFVVFFFFLQNARKKGNAELFPDLI